MNRPLVVVLDLDGVIVKSNFIKHRAMLSLFSDAPEHQQAISSFILDHGGVPRLEKIVAILEGILKVHAAPTLVAEYLSRYSRALEQSLLEAPLVEGVSDLVESRAHPFYVCSSAPEREVALQLERAGLAQYFEGIFGRDTPMALALQTMAMRHQDADVIFFGDSMGDQVAALEAGVGFVAVVNERDNFEGQQVVKLTDFSSPEILQASMRKALGYDAN